MKPTIEHTALKAGRFGHLPAKTCCAECPLRRDSTPGALGGYTAEQYLDVLHGPADIACHMSKGFNVRNPDDQRSCTGVAMYRANVGLRPWGHALDAVAHVGPDRALVFAAPAEFWQHHRVASERNT